MLREEAVEREDELIFTRSGEEDVLLPPASLPKGRGAPAVVLQCVFLSKPPTTRSSSWRSRD
jgi:hypothetical protein